MDKWTSGQAGKWASFLAPSPPRPIAHSQSGANHANLVMRYLVEAPILGASRNMHGANPTITDIRVEVITDENRQPREGTAELGKIAEVYEEVARQMSVK